MTAHPVTSRETVLERIRAALADVPAGEDPGGIPVPRDYRTDHVGPDRVEVFAERAADYRATVVRAPAGDAREHIAAALRARAAARLVVPDGFPDDLLPAGTWQVLRDRPPLSPADLDGADAVLTTAALGIAATGTVVLDAGPGQGRRALTLLPDYHLCVLSTDRIVGDLPDALARLDPAAPQTWISGPSATSDIELERVEGVHGPRTLHIVLVEDRPAAQEKP